MRSSVVMPQATVGSERNSFNSWNCHMCDFTLYCLKTVCILKRSKFWHILSKTWQFLESILLVFSFMLLVTIWRPECLIAEIAGDDDSFKVVCFNVIFYRTTLAFLSTNFTHIGFFIPVRQVVSAFLHHWLHFFFKSIHISWEVARNSKWSIFFSADARCLSFESYIMVILLLRKQAVVHDLWEKSFIKYFIQKR